MRTRGKERERETGKKWERMRRRWSREWEIWFAAWMLEEERVDQAQRWNHCTRSLSLSPPLSFLLSLAIFPPTSFLNCSSSFFFTPFKLQTRGRGERSFARSEPQCWSLYGRFTSPRETPWYTLVRRVYSESMYQIIVFVRILWRVSGFSRVKEKNKGKNKRFEKTRYARARVYETRAKGNSRTWDKKRSSAEEWTAKSSSRYSLRRLWLHSTMHSPKANRSTIDPVCETRNSNPPWISNLFAFFLLFFVALISIRRSMQYLIPAKIFKAPQALCLIGPWFPFGNLL